MFRSLYARLALVLVGLVAVSGALYMVLTLHAGRLYFQELNQQLNHTLAANLIKEKGLTIEDGLFDREALSEVFHTYMVVNPAIEVYLLDAGGRILAYSAPPGKVKRKRVDLAPVRTFLHDTHRRPIVGDDPRHRGARRIFSAAPIGPADTPEGYLYVVLAGEELNSLAHMLQGSYILRLTVYGLVAVAVIGVVAGLLLLRLVTRRLRTLDRAMAAFEADGFERLSPPAGLDTRSEDELGRLGRTFTRMGERITNQVSALKQTDALRRELVANVSHDLRTPIASLQGYLETLLMKDTALSAAQRRQYLRIAMTQSERLGKLVGELFDLAKLESGHTQLHAEPFALGELVHDVVLSYRLAAQRRDVHIEAQIPDNLPFVNADVGLIERVLQNLLDNALRHTEAGGRVEVALRDAGDAVTVQVADTGHGIPPEELPYVFDRFYQVKKSEREGRGGVGLGLAVAKRILELHDTSIAVDSAPEAGTRFDFTLPTAA